MTAKGHVLLASALAYIPLVEVLQRYGYKEAFIASASLLLGSLLPDIDEPKSYIGRRTAIISDSLKFFGLKHRGFTHFLIVPVVIALIALALNDSLYAIALLSLAFGILAHDIGDLLTKGGINGFFYPFFIQAKIGLLPRIMRFETFSITESFLNFALLVLNFYLYFSYFIPMEIFK